MFFNLALLLLAFPAGTQYKLEGFSIGGGGGSGGSSPSYLYQTRTGEVGGNLMTGSTYSIGAGLAFLRQASGPKAPTFVNSGEEYCKLHLTIDTSGNPSDTKFAVAISDDDFVTTNYVKSDMTVGTSLALTDYLTYTQWGGVTGVDIIGLDVGTSYTVKVKAMQGSFTETDWGPEVSAATVNPTLTFGLGVSDVDAMTDPPYAVDLGDLYPGSVTSATERVWVHLTTNALNGASVFVYGQNAGLKSDTVGYTISTVNADLGTTSGFGIQGDGSDLTISSPYNSGGNTVGVVDLLVRPIFGAAVPISDASVSIVVKAKSDNNTPSASDYAEVVTVIASANY